MENQQPLQTPVQIPDFQPKPNYLKTIIFLILIVLTLGLIAYLFFQNQKLQKQVLNPPVSPTIQIPSPVSQSVSPTSKPSSSISIQPDETAGWKTYSSNEFYFKYPEKWVVEGKKISSAKPLIEMWTFGSNDSLYNECMKLDNTKIIGDITVKSFSGITTSEMCSPTNVNLKEKWIVRTGGKGYAPGLQYSYKSESPESENFFNQILSTFKFVGEN
ncbi:MAG: hypothetical protein AAB569_06390 [Patescibacteria group bacterium]